MKFKFIRTPQKRKMEKELGFKIPYQLIKLADGKIFAFSGNLAKEDITELNKITNIRQIGILLDKIIKGQ